MSTPTATDQFVLDGSVTLAWLFHDEQDPYADAIVARLPDIEMHVPRLWHLELANVLLVGERRGRCTQADTTSWLGFLAGGSSSVRSNRATKHKGRKASSSDLSCRGLSSRRCFPISFGP